MAECEKYRSGEIDGAYVTLACWLPDGHDGPHWDEADDLSWFEGRWSAEARAVEREEAHDAAGEAWDLGAYGEGGTS